MYELVETTARVGKVQDTQVSRWRQWSRSLSRETATILIRWNSLEPELWRGQSDAAGGDELMTVRWVTLLQQEPTSHANIALRGKEKGGGDRYGTPRQGTANKMKQSFNFNCNFQVSNWVEYLLHYDNILSKLFSVWPLSDQKMLWWFSSKWVQKCLLPK